MNIVKLAYILEQKYAIKIATVQDDINFFKKDLINIYNLYINARSKDPVFQILADSGESFSKDIIARMEEIIANIDSHELDKVTSKINEVLDLLNNDNILNVLKEINKTKPKNQQHLNYIEHLKKKFVTVSGKLTSSLSRLMGKYKTLTTYRQPLSKDKLRRFMMTPGAQAYGLDDIDVMTEILFYPDLREKVTTLINAIDRGHIPVDGHEVGVEARTIKQKLDERKSSNISALENEG